MLDETYKISQALTGPARAMINLDTLAFFLPPELEASEPPEARGLARDEVRLMVSHYQDDRIRHARFRDLPEFLQPGDCLVINTSGTLNAALNARLDNGMPIELHLSTHLPSGQWTVELRLLTGQGTAPFFDATAGDVLQLAGGGQARLIAPYSIAVAGQGHRLWRAELRLPVPWRDYLKAYGFPIRYAYVPKSWPGSYYQTVYATEAGSAEMPAAGRAFTPELITRLVANGIQVTPLLLHTGVASLEDHEPPYAEYYRVSKETAQVINAARAAGHRIIAVGTTVVRALETVSDQGHVHAGKGWTERVITPQSQLDTVDAILTGLHEPSATHLAMLEALAGRKHLQAAYNALLAEGYLWHEFGDLHLILP